MEPASGTPAPRVALGLGSNLGDRAEMLRRAVEGIAAFARVDAVSDVYATAPRDLEDQPEFLNAVALVTPRAGHDPRSFLERCLALEAALGRMRRVPRGPRTIDIDLLVWGEARIAEPGLALPHPRLHLRRFVLVPLAELAPELQVAGLGTVADLLARCPDTGQVRHVGALRLR